jgi:site-specific DNA-methyltransferase (adenine-specific)
MVWVKSAPSGFLNAKKMPLRKHEMVYVFYRKLPLYDLSSHKNKFLKEVKNREGNCYGKGKEKSDMSCYEPTLPTSILREECNVYGNHKVLNRTSEEGVQYVRGTGYEPPLPDTILEIKSERGKHSTQKPTALIEWCLKYYSKEGDMVLDPTMGSGSTSVACKNMKRQFIGIEKDKDIYDVAVKRTSS